MKNVILGLFLTLALLVIPSAKAQFHTTDACNNTVSGKMAGVGRGANGAVAIRVQTEAVGYTPQGDQQVVRDDKYTQSIVAGLNEMAENNKDAIRFSAAEFDSPEETRNLTFYYVVYWNTDNTYNVFLSVNGWGIGHLFNVSELNSVDAGDGVVAVTIKAEKMLGEGYTCAN